MSYELLASLGRQAGNHLWQSTLFAVAVGVLTLAFRANRAPVRYGLWLAASLKFLVPFSLLSAVGSWLGARFAPAAPAPRFSSIMAGMARPLAPLRDAIPAGPAPAASPDILPLAALFALWFCGCAAVLVHFGRRWRRVRAIVRASSAVPSAATPRVVSGRAALEPGVFGVFRPLLYLPAELLKRLSGAELDAILAHELCHVRRRDNLTAALHMAVEILFWFHPLVWWLGARLVEERERACDEEVLRLGIEPQVYAASILQVCSISLKSPSALVAAVTGSRLKKRVEEIMKHRIVERLSSGRKLLLAGAALAAVAGPVLTGVIGGPRLRASAVTSLVPSGPRFAAASITPARGWPATHVGMKTGADGIEIGRWSIAQLILRAYGLKSYQLSGPDWMHRQRFDIAARFPEGATEDQISPMLQWLLADRFGLLVHRETQDLPGFALTVGPEGPKMSRADVPAEPSLDRGRTLDSLFGDGELFGAGPLRMAGSDLHMKFAKLPMDTLAYILASWMRAPVIDMTGLEGKYQVTLDFAPDVTAGRGTPVFTAVERLGLRLERRQLPVAVVIVDHVEAAPAPE